MHRAFCFRLYPTDEQANSLRHFVGVTRLIYNLALEQRRDFYRQYARETGKRFNYVTQGHEVTKLRAEYDWIAAVPFVCQVQALKDLDKAFQAFWRGNGFPRMRQKGINDSFRIIGRDVSFKRLNTKWSAIRIPKIGWIKYRNTRPISGKVNNITASFRSGVWQISVACELIDHVAAPIATSVGIDRGVANTLALSSGEMFSLPAAIDDLDKRRRRAQRAVARRKRGSKRRLRAIRKVARLHARAARIRRDWHHRTALDIARRYGFAVLEDLNIANMTRSAAGTIEQPGKNVRAKAGLNRSILKQGWYAFEIILTYKLEERGGQLIKVPAEYTSQTCPECGSIDSKSRESQASFVCRHCGHAAHADVNAAINILRRSTASMRVEDSRQATVEARTGLGREAHENHLTLVG